MMIEPKLTRLRVVLAAVVLSAVFAGSTAASSLAAPKLRVYLQPISTVTAGQRTIFAVAFQNVGDAPTSGTITFRDTVGPGLASLQPGAFQWQDSAEATAPPPGPQECATAGASMTCTWPGSLPAGAQFRGTLEAEVLPTATGSLTNTFSVSGGGTGGTVSSEQTMTVGPRGLLGFSELAAELLGDDEMPDLQAGSDPAEFTTRVHFDSYVSQFAGLQPLVVSNQHFRNVTVNLPPGLIGNPAANQTCTAAELTEATVHTQSFFTPDCPPDSQVGIAHLFLGGGSIFVGLYNMVAPPGAATELGFVIYGTPVLLDAYVRPVDHGISIVSRDTSTSLPVMTADITVWGVPADPSHDPYRGDCVLGAEYQGPNGESCPTQAPRRAFLRLPTSCPGSPPAFSATADSYENSETSGTFSSPALGGCEFVPFAPELAVEPTGTAANSPTGVSVRLALPQNDNPDGLAEADLKKAVVRLPLGMALNPSAADGLQACSDEQLGLGTERVAACPDASKVGTVLLHTPLLTEPIEGAIYVRSQNSGDPASGEMFRIAIELRNDQRGIDIKLPGQVAADPVTGQLTSTFDDAPQLPFSDITLSFKAGARAPLTTPASCGPQTTTADLYSWARPDVAVHRSMTFDVVSGADGTPCASPPAFNPGFDAGAASVQAGAFTPFLTTFTRGDTDQSMQRVSVKLPPGLSGSLSSVALCPEPQASLGTCGPESEIGTVTAGAGDGPTPFYVTGGRVYITKPYEGAPFGLSVVVPAKAGPFDLGTVVVRARVDVDPHTAQLTVTTDALPQVVGGVPVDLRLVNVTINRAKFTFNPTSCDAMSVDATITGNQGASAARSNHFQVTNCGALAFKPKFAVSTSGRTSRARGASLTAKLSYPNAPAGSQANIARVKVDLPRQLPSRLKTLQQACPAATFAGNPAGCPSGSVIGSAKASTPILPVPLTGPVYFVSNGGEAFPDLVVVLQGYGVTVDLIGSTFISKTGITSSTFKSVPDVPVNTFQLTLPEGPNSALAANGNLCKGKLKMPTAFVAQDGVEVRQSTKITTTGCPKAKKKPHVKKKPGKRSR